MSSDSSSSPQNGTTDADTNASRAFLRRLRDIFAPAATFLREDKGIQPTAILTGILLGTTALATPLLGTAVGAATAMAAGMYLLMKTSDTVVNNIASIGKKLGIAPMTLGIGLGLLTSLPELMVSGGAMLKGNPALGIGNVVGSNIANLLLILGATAAIKKIKPTGNSWKFNAVAMGASTAIFGTQLALGALNPIIGACMLGGLGLYLWQSYKSGQKDMAGNEQTPSAASTIPSTVVKPASDATATESKESKLPTWLNVTLGLAGVAGLVGAAGFLVTSATAFGIAAGVSPAVIGVLAVAIGTSLPELTVNIKAALKGETDMAVGNILGSNVFNVLMIGGILSMTGTIVPGDLAPRETMLGLLNTAAFGLSAALTWGAMKLRKGGLDRKDGVIGVGLYAAYTAATLALGTGVDTAAVTPPPADTVISAPAPAVTPVPAPTFTLPTPPSR